MIAQQLTLRWAIIPDYLDAPPCNHRSPFKWKREQKREIQGKAAQKGLNPLLLLLKIEGARSQGIQAAFRSYNKGQEMDSSLEGPEGIQPSWHFVAHGDPFQTSDFQRVPPVSFGSFVTVAKHSSQSSLEATSYFFSSPPFSSFSGKYHFSGSWGVLPDSSIDVTTGCLQIDGHCISWPSQVVQW